MNNMQANNMMEGQFNEAKAMQQHVLAMQQM